MKAYVKHVTPRMGPFWQHGHNLIKPGGGVYFLIPKFYAKWLKTRRFLCVPYINLWKTSESGVEPLLAIGP